MSSSTNIVSLESHRQQLADSKRLSESTVHFLETGIRDVIRANDLTISAELLEDHTDALLKAVVGESIKSCIPIPEALVERVGEMS